MAVSFIFCILQSLQFIHSLRITKGISIALGTYTNYLCQNSCTELLRTYHWSFAQRLCKTKLGAVSWSRQCLCCLDWYDFPQEQNKQQLNLGSFLGNLMCHLFVSSWQNTSPGWWSDVSPNSYSVGITMPTVLQSHTKKRNGADQKQVSSGWRILHGFVRKGPQQITYLNFFMLLLKQSSSCIHSHLCHIYYSHKSCTKSHQL